MLVCLFAMLLPLWNAPPQINGRVELLAAQSSVPQAVNNQFGGRPIFGPDDPTPDIRLHSAASGKVNVVEIESGSLSSDNSIAGISDVSDSLATILKSEEVVRPVKSSSIFSWSLLFFLSIAALVAWSVLRYRSKRVPNFIRRFLPELERSKTESESESEEIEHPANWSSNFGKSFPSYVLNIVAQVPWNISRLGSKSRLSLKRAPDFMRHDVSERKRSETERKLNSEFKASKQLQQNGSDEGIPKTDELPLAKKESAVDEGIPKMDELPLGKTGPSMLEFLELEPQLKGQFKVATRFQRSKSQEGASAHEEETQVLKATVNGDKSSVGVGEDVLQQVDMSRDRPADDEFEFDEFEFKADDFEEYRFDDSAYVPGMFSEEQRAKILEAAEILAAAERRRNGRGGSRVN